MPLSIHGPDIEWELRRGDEVVEVLEDWSFPNPFNKVLRAKGPIDAFQLCATVQGVEGCLSATRSVADPPSRHGLAGPRG